MMETDTSRDSRSLPESTDVKNFLLGHPLGSPLVFVKTPKTNTVKYDRQDVVSERTL